MAYSEALRDAAVRHARDAIFNGPGGLTAESISAALKLLYDTAYSDATWGALAGNSQQA
jgi:hypothetical protein